MDTATVNKLGLTPLKPELDRIAALTTAAELPALLAHLQSIGVNAFFGMGSNQDYADSSAVITSYGAGGLGLPERDYYTRTDAKSVEQRQQYVDHVKRMFTLASEPEAQAAKDAEAVLAIETRPVSYTHLDVYKRQTQADAGHFHAGNRCCLHGKYLKRCLRVGPLV